MGLGLAHSIGRFGHSAGSARILARHEAGEVAEWSNVPDSKSGVGATLPWVRIPPSPPDSQQIRAFRALFCFYPPIHPPSGFVQSSLMVSSPVPGYFAAQGFSATGWVRGAVMSG
jgi:hypothetical protein